MTPTPTFTVIDFLHQQTSANYLSFILLMTALQQKCAVPQKMKITFTEYLAYKKGKGQTHRNDSALYSICFRKYSAIFLKHS
jgi:hypothetical protein